jgi:glycosyltransferase involved in cell wall biosynthesis
LRGDLEGGRVSERLLVMIPALNAAPSIGRIVAECRQQSEPVLVIDDGSTDGTGEIARQAGAVVLWHEVNRGKGAALKTGFAYALENGFDGVITLDADGQHLPAEIPKIRAERAASGADLIIGGRAHLFDHMLPRRRMANRFSAWSIAKASGTRVSDSQSGFRFYSTAMLRSITLKSDGFDLESEVIVRAGRGGFRLMTTPIELGFVDGVGTSHYRPLVDSLRIAWTVFKTRFFWT